MADYISREAAISEIMSEPTDAHFPSWYAEKLKQIPAADVRPAIRCNNCRYYFLGDCTHNQGMKKTDKDGFCFRFEAVSNE